MKNTSRFLIHVTTWVGLVFALQMISLLAGGLWLAVSIMFLFVVFIERWRAIITAAVVVLSARFLPSWVLYIEYIVAVVILPDSVMFGEYESFYSAIEYHRTKVALAQVSAGLVQIGLTLTGITVLSFGPYLRAHERPQYYRRVRKAVWTFYREVREQRQELRSESELFRYDKRMLDVSVEWLRSRETKAA